MLQPSSRTEVRCRCPALFSLIRRGAWPVRHDATWANSSQSLFVSKMEAHEEMTPVSRGIIQASIVEAKRREQREAMAAVTQIDVSATADALTWEHES